MNSSWGFCGVLSSLHLSNILIILLRLLNRTSFISIMRRTVRHSYTSTTTCSSFFKSFTFIIISPLLLIDWFLFYIVLVINMSSNISINFLLRRRTSIRHRNIVGTRSNVSSRWVSCDILLTSETIWRRCFIIRSNISSTIVVSHLLVVISLSRWNLFLSILSKFLLSLLSLFQSLIQWVFFFLIVQFTILLLLNLLLKVWLFSPPSWINLRLHWTWLWSSFPSLLVWIF